MVPPATGRQSRRQRNHIEKPPRGSNLNVGLQPIASQLRLEADQPHPPSSVSMYTLTSQSTPHGPIQESQSFHAPIPFSDYGDDTDFYGQQDASYSIDSQPPPDLFGAQPSSSSDTVQHHGRIQFPYSEHTPIPSSDYGDNADRIYGQQDASYSIDSQPPPDLFGAQPSSSSHTVQHHGRIQFPYPARLDDPLAINHLRGQVLDPIVEQAVLRPRPSVFAEGNNLRDPSINSLCSRSHMVAPYPQIRLVAALAPLREGEDSRRDIQVIQSIKTTVNLSKVSHDRLLRSLPPTPPPQSVPPPRLVSSSTDHSETLHELPQTYQQVPPPPSLLSPPPQSRRHGGSMVANNITSKAKATLKCLVLTENPFPDSSQRDDMIQRSFLSAARTVLGSDAQADEWVNTNRQKLYRSLSTIVNNIRLTFKTMAENLVPHAFGLHLPISYAAEADAEHKRETTAFLLADLNFFLVDNDGIQMPVQPVLISIILQTVFYSHGGKLQEFVDISRMDVVFALTGTAVCCVLMEYQTGTYGPQDFGANMYSTFNRCMDKLREIRDDPVSGALLDSVQARVVARGGRLS